MGSVDIFSLLPKEAHAAIDAHGYEFLKMQGYDVRGVKKSYKRRARLKDALKKRGEELRHCAAIDSDTKAILVWFVLYREEIIARSTGLKFIQREGDNGEGREDIKNQD